MANPFIGLQGAAVAFVVLVMIVSVGALILTNFQANITDTTGTAYLTVGKGLTSLSDFGGWFGTLVAVLIGAVLIGMVLYYFGNQNPQ
jgi:hypothetical protein